MGLEEYQPPSPCSWSSCLPQTGPNGSWSCRYRPYHPPPPLLPPTMACCTLISTFINLGTSGPCVAGQCRHSRVGACLHVLQLIDYARYLQCALPAHTYIQDTQVQSICKVQAEVLQTLVPARCATNFKPRMCSIVAARYQQIDFGLSFQIWKCIQIWAFTSNGKMLPRRNDMQHLRFAHCGFG